MWKLAVLLAFAVITLSACGGEEVPGLMPDESAPTSPADGATLTVDANFKPNPDDGIYIEGALADIIVRDGSGTVAGHETKDPSGTIRFPDLPLGTYVVEAALRPCDGNCGYLDPRTDSCRLTVDLHANPRIRVDFRVAHPCRMTS